MLQVHQCPHLADVPFEFVIRCFNSPSFKNSVTSRSQRCDTCRETEDLWACLGHEMECRFVGCGRQMKAHGLAHFEDKRHPLSIGIDNKMIWCYACDAEIIDSAGYDHQVECLTRYERVKEVRAALQSVWCVTPSRQMAHQGAVESAKKLSMSRRGTVGLVNLGNTCFMNATLQCLVHVHHFQKFFRKYVLQSPQDPNAQAPTWGQKLMNGFKRWCETDWGDTVGVAPHSPEEILNVVSHSYPQFQGYRQQDSQEFLRAALDCIHEEVKQKVPVYPMAYLKKHFPENSVLLEERVMTRRKQRKKKRKQKKETNEQGPLDEYESAKGDKTAWSGWSGAIPKPHTHDKTLSSDGPVKEKICTNRTERRYVNVDEERGQREDMQKQDKEEEKEFQQDKEEQHLKGESEDKEKEKEESERTERNRSGRGSDKIRGERTRALNPSDDHVSPPSGVLVECERTPPSDVNALGQSPATVTPDTTATTVTATTAAPAAGASSSKRAERSTKGWFGSTRVGITTRKEDKEKPSESERESEKEKDDEKVLVGKDEEKKEEEGRRKGWFAAARSSKLSSRAGIIAETSEKEKDERRKKKQKDEREGKEGSRKSWFSTQRSSREKRKEGDKQAKYEVPQKGNVNGIYSGTEPDPGSHLLDKTGDSDEQENSSSTEEDEDEDENEEDQKKNQIKKKKKQKTQKEEHPSAEEDPADQTTMRSVTSDIFEGQSVSILRCCACDEVSRTIETMHDVSVAIPTAHELLEMQLKAAADAKFERRGGKSCPPYRARSSRPSSSSSSSAYPPRADRVSSAVSSYGGTGSGSGGILGRFSGSMRNWFVSDAKTPITLIDCLRKYCETEILTGKEKYECETCDALVNCKKKMLFHKLPEVLCIHLKRFNHEGSVNEFGLYAPDSGSASRGQKNGKYVQFPLENLDLTEFMHRTGMLVEEEAMDGGDERGAIYSYHLIGLVEHSGDLNRGHYIALCRHQARPDEWYEFDDATTSKVDIERVESAEAYILFYQREVPEARLANRNKLKRDIVATRARLQEAAAKKTDSKSSSSTSVPDVCYVPTSWYVHHQTLTRSIPIDNYLLVCSHGRTCCVDRKVAEKRFMPVSSALYRELADIYGGGPTLQDLDPCIKCVAHIKAHNTRKQMEYNLVSKYDSNRDVEPCWFIIDLHWVDKWKKYMRGRASIDDVRDFCNPGFLDNSGLYTKEGTIRPHLRVKIDYMCINASVWRLFRNMHGCRAPFICRRKPCIYSEEVLLNSRLYIDEVVNARPLVELIRDKDSIPCSWIFVDKCKGDETELQRLADKFHGGDISALIRSCEVPEEKKERNNRSEEQVVGEKKKMRGAVRVHKNKDHAADQDKAFREKRKIIKEIMNDDEGIILDDDDEDAFVTGNEE